jgi:hypothetical protein
MNETKLVLELLRKAVAILESEKPEPTPIRALEPGEDEVVHEGTIGRPEFKLVGTDGITLLTFGLKVRTPEGHERWCNAQEWRTVAMWGMTILIVGQWCE